jgi:hypothetical protein
MNYSAAEFLAMLAVAVSLFSSVLVSIPRRPAVILVFKLSET